MPESHEPLFFNEEISLNRFILGGLAIGLIFPISAIIMDVIIHELPVTFTSVIYIYQINPIHYIVGFASLALSITAYIVGLIIQSQAQVTRQNIVNSKKKLHYVLNRDPDAIFLVRTSDLKIEQYNHMALQLCDIDSKDTLNSYAPEFFTSLNESLSVLAQLVSEGNTFTTEEVLTTAKGNMVWGQVSLYTFSLQQENYQLIRIADITPMKQREIELKMIESELKQHSEEIQLANEEAIAINENLEHIVEERTNALHERNEQLAKYAFLNAHKIRGPLARILGSSYALKYVENEDERQLFIHSVTKSAQELDTVIHKMAQVLSIADDQQREEFIDTIEEKTAIGKECADRFHSNS